MSSSTKENIYTTKKEDGVDDAKIPKGMYGSRSWQGLKDPRIVRVSRSFGGKDRHSKVRTIKGLRDRRVRLSVQTAIQLYDLQDSLGLSQPSKAVDWLLSAAQHEINKLPPLPMPPEFFLQYPQPVVVSHGASAPQNPCNSLTNADIEQIAGQRMRPSSTTDGNTRRSSAGIAEEHRTSSRCKQWNLCAPLWTESREVGRAANVEKNDWIQGNGQENKVPNEVLSASIPAIVPVPPHNYSSIPNTSYCHWNLHPNAFNLTGHGCSSQSTGESHNFSTPLLPPSFSLPFGSQLIFPSHLNMSTDSDPKQTSQIQMLSSSSQQLFPNSITSSLYSTPNQDSESSPFLNQP